MRQDNYNNEAPLIDYAGKLGLCLCLAVFWALSESVLAKYTNETPVIDGQLQFFAPDMGTVLVAPLALETEIIGSVHGPIFRAKVSQRFQNPSDQWLEGVYTFPLPTDASVDTLNMRIGDRVIEGQIKEKQQARKTYDKAKQEGKRSALIEAPKGNLFTTRVANIAPRSDIVIEFSYQQILGFRDHGYELRLPIVATPQFNANSPAPDAPIEPKHAATMDKIAYKEAGEPNTNPVSISITVDAGMPIAKTWSDSHHVDITSTRQGVFTATMASSAEHANRDFILNWRHESIPQAQAVLFSEQKDGEHYHMLSILPPAPDSRLTPVEREVIFVLDVSGSMAGASIRQAKRALNKAIDALSPNDQVNLIFFNDESWSVFAKPKLANQHHLKQLRQALTKQDAGKGTRIKRALRLALQTPPTSRLRQVVFITDGAVHNEDRLLAFVQRNLGATRLFTVGIGAAPNGYFMRRAAEVGRGTFTFISDVNQVDEKISALFEKLNHPALTELTMTLDTAYRDLLPNPLPDLYLNETKYLLFRTDHPVQQFAIGANQGDVPILLQQAVTPNHSAKGVAIEWARRKIQYYTDKALRTSEDVRARFEQSATELALAHHQVSRFTSLVAVDVTPARTNEALLRLKLKSNLPKGWKSKGITSQRLYLAQTANGSVLLIGIGLSNVLAATLLLAWYRRRRTALRGSHEAL